MKLLSDREYDSTGGTSIFQCILGGGTATLSAKAVGASAFTVFKTFSADEIVEVNLPAGQYKCTLTGAAEVSRV